MKKNTNNKYSKFRPIGLNIFPLKYSHENSDAHGRDIQLIRDEIPNRIDEISDILLYIGWAEFGSVETEPIWKIKKVSQVGTVWKQEFVNGEQEYRYKWSDRTLYNYS